MKRHKNLFVTVTLLVCCGLALGGVLRAEDQKDKEFSGSFMLGYRFVNLGDGAVESKYKEDINLEKGPRLFGFKLRYAPQGEMKKVLDSLELRLNNLGGDPFESFGIQAVKYGKYLFQFDRRKSTYFYADNLAAGDMNRWDFDRVNDSGLIKIWLPADAHLYMSYNRFTKKGSSQTTMDVGRLEIEFDKPVNDKSTDVTIGADISSKLFSVLVEQRFLDYTSANSLFLPGYVDGGADAEYPSSLSLYYLNQPYAIKGHTTVAKLTLTPFKNLLMHGSLQLTNQRTTLGYAEGALGVDYDGSPIAYSHEGAGRFDRDIQNYDFDFTYILSAKLAVVGAARYSHLDQNVGELASDEGTSTVFNEYETGSVEGGLQYQFSRRFGFTAGYRFEKRDIKLPADEPRIEEEGVTATRQGVFGNLRWTPGKSFTFTADYQFGSTDHPFTLVGPSTSHRARVTAKYKAGDFYCNGSYLYSKSLSDIEDEGGESRAWEADKNQLGLRLGYQGQKLNLFAGYSLIDVTRKGDRVVFYPPDWSGPAGSYEWDINFTGKSTLWDGYLAYAFSPAWDFGTYINAYTNTGSWALSRFMWKAFLRHDLCNGLSAELAYRYVNFKEKLRGLNNYKARILEVSVGYRW